MTISCDRQKTVKRKSETGISKLQCTCPIPHAHSLLAWGLLAHSPRSFLYGYFCYGVKMSICKRAYSSCHPAFMGSRECTNMQHRVSWEFALDTSCPHTCSNPPAHSPWVLILQVCFIIPSFWLALHCTSWSWTGHKIKHKKKSRMF